MDNRLVIPKNMRENVLRAIHFGHAGRDAMLKEAADIWWPRVHRDVASGCKVDNKVKKPKQRKEDKSTKTPKMSEMTNKAEKAKLKRKIFESESEPEDVGFLQFGKIYRSSITLAKH